ncbi:MAG: hypothetical protein KAX57_02160 [Rhodoferax sp.]|nr:hypothetical protein [Rhodoferax sp.]
MALLEGSWTRGRPSKGLRQVNVRYQVEDPQWREIEDLLERVPYKKVNEVMRYALLLGSKILLSTNEQGQAISNLPSTPVTKLPQAAQPSAVESSVEVTPQGPQYSQAAKNMFDTFGSQN